MGEAQRFYDLFTMFYAPEDILLFPAREYIFYNFESISRTQELERIAALSRLRAGRYKIALVPADALMQLLPPADFIRENTMELAAGGRCPLGELTAFSRAGRVCVLRRSPRARASFRTAADCRVLFAQLRLSRASGAVRRRDRQPVLLRCADTAESRAGRQRLHSPRARSAPPLSRRAR